MFFVTFPPPTKGEENIGSNLDAGEPSDYDRDEMDDIGKDEVLGVPFESQCMVLACVSGCRSKHHHHTLYYILVLALFTSVNRTFTIPKRAFSQNGLVRIIQPNSAELGVT